MHHQRIDICNLQHTPHFTATMPQAPTPLIHRPQTLKQAKKAYRKSTGAVRLSESEKAMLERRAVLQERADRINEREARRKANLKKKEERVQREREVRHRMGVPTPPRKEGIHVGPSQLHLSGFIYGGAKRKREDDEDEKDGEESGAQKEKQLVVPEQYERSMEPPRSRQVPQAFSTNASTKWMMPSQTMDTIPSKVLDLTLQRNQIPQERTLPARSPLQAKSANPTTIQQKPLARNTKSGEIQANSSHLQRLQGSPPNQQPLDPSNQAPTTNPPVFKKPPSLPPPTKPDSVPEDYLDFFFVSNTQIQRELSPAPTPPPKTASPNNATSVSLPPPQPPTPPNPPATSNPHPIATDNTADLLAFISTQDLDFSDEPTQLSPLAPPKPPHHEPHTEEEEEQEESEDFPDSELESIVLSFSLESPTPDPQTPNPPLQTHNSSISHHTTTTNDATDASNRTTPHNLYQTQGRHEQEGPQRQASQRGVAAEYDAFELLCTQDLMELES